MYEPITLINTLLYIGSASVFFVDAFAKNWFYATITDYRTGISRHFTYGLMTFCDDATGKCYKYDDFNSSYYSLFTLEMYYYVLLVGGSFLLVSVLLSFFKTSHLKNNEHSKAFIVIAFFANLACSVSFGCIIALVWRVLFRMNFDSRIDFSGNKIIVTRGLGYYLSFVAALACLVAFISNSVEWRMWKQQRLARGGSPFHNAIDGYKTNTNYKTMS